MFSPKYNIGPLLICHIWKTYSCPVLRSGLSSLVLLPSHLIPLHKFHKKILRSFLRLSDQSPIPVLYPLLGECPMDSCPYFGQFGTILSPRLLKSFSIFLQSARTTAEHGAITSEKSVRNMNFRTHSHSFNLTQNPNQVGNSK